MRLWDRIALVTIQSFRALLSVKDTEDIALVILGHDAITVRVGAAESLSE